MWAEDEEGAGVGLVGGVSEGVSVMSKEICQRCNEKELDRRTLWMACFYAMEELGLPFKQMKAGDQNFFTLRVCKACRADWMRAIQKWFNEKPVKESCGSGIFVRRNGATIEITEEAWKQLYPDREPVRIRE